MWRHSEEPDEEKHSCFSCQSCLAEEKHICFVKTNFDAAFWVWVMYIILKLLLKILKKVNKEKLFAYIYIYIMCLIF